MGFKAVALAWGSVFNEAENKFYPDALSYLQRCSQQKIKIVLFSTQKENDPLPSIKKSLNEKKLAVDEIIWAQSNNEADIKHEVVNQVSYDPTRTIGDLSEKELFYAENRKKFFDTLLDAQNARKKFRAFMSAITVFALLALTAIGVAIAYGSGGTAAAWLTFALEKIAEKMAPWLFFTIVSTVSVIGTLFAALIGSMSVRNDVNEESDEKQPLLDSTDKKVKETLKDKPALPNGRSLSNSDKKRMADIAEDDKELATVAVPPLALVKEAPVPQQSSKRAKR